MIVSWWANCVRNLWFSLPIGHLTVPA